MSERANFGCGGQIVAGWINVDRDFSLHEKECEQNICMVHDLRDPLPLGTDVLDYAVAHHVLDLLAPLDIVPFLAECARVIKPNGVLRISLAHIEAAISAAERDDKAWFADLGLRATTIEEAVTEYVYLNGARKSLLTRTLVAHALEQARMQPFIVAYKHTIRIGNDITALDARPTESIWIEGLV